MTSPQEIAAAVDGLLQEREQFDFVLLLERFDCLHDLADPHAVDTPAVSRLRCPSSQAETLIKQASSYSDALGLLRLYPPRSAELVQAMSALRPAAYGLEELLRQVRARPGGRPQLDLFHDNRLLHVEARLRSALVDNRLVDAERQLTQLPNQASAVAARNGWQQLIAAQANDSTPPAQRLKALETELSTLARRHLGAAASAYLRRLWRQLAVALDNQSFDAEQPHLHASHAWQQAREWQGVCHSIEAELQWQSQPVLMQRLIEASQQLSALQTSRRLWVQFCWQHPDAAEAALNGEQGDATLNAHWQTFIDAEPVLEVVDFPAWLLLSDTAQMSWLPPDDLPAAPRQIYCALRALMQSGGAMDARRQLHALHPGLLKHYLAVMAAA